MNDLLSPFSTSALASLPSPQRPTRYTRTDGIPDTEENDDGERPTVRDYHAINSVPPQVRVPKKIATPVKVEGKVWFANERSELVYFSLYKRSSSLIAHHLCSLGSMAEYLDPDRHTGARPFQRVQRPGRPQFCIHICLY